MRHVDSNAALVPQQIRQLGDIRRDLRRLIFARATWLPSRRREAAARD
jgi:hypothetical protein